VVRIYERFANGASLAQSFLARFGTELEDESINQPPHQIVIVAAELDANR